MTTLSTTSSKRVGGGLLDPKMLLTSLPSALRKLNPGTLWRNPVMFIVWVGALFTTILAIAEPSGANATARTTPSRVRRVTNSPPRAGQSETTPAMAMTAAPRLLARIGRRKRKMANAVFCAGMALDCLEV